MEAKFEHHTDLGTPGRASQTDLLVLARTSDGLGVVAVEGKADESFGEIVDRWLGHADKGTASEVDGGGPAPLSGKLVRLKSICATLGLNTDDVTQLRYQLLHRTVAALIEAKRFNCRHALMLIHHFSTGPDKSAGNVSDFAKFCAALGVPNAGVNWISEPVVRNGIRLRFAWVDEECAPSQEG